MLVEDKPSFLPFLCSKTGWRVTAFISGACGVACGAVLFFTVEHNPVRVSESPHPELEYDQIPNDEMPEMTSSAIQKPLKVMEGVYGEA